MANIELWRGQSKNLTISNLQTDTLKNGHISKYVFDSDNSGNTELSGCGQLENAKTTITTITSVNQSKQYNISAYLLYSHKFPGSETTYATSNKDVTTLTVKEPLDGTSLTGLNINGENWVWSNADSKEFSITPSFAAANPFSKNGKYVTNATVQNSSIGYVTTIPSGAADITTIKLQWNKSTGNSTDLGSGQKSINVNVKSTKESAPTASIISAYSATLTVWNAVTGLGGLSNAEIYARATTQISQTVTFTPTNPYSKALELVGEDNQQISGNSINIDGAVLQLSNDNQTVTLNASDATNTVDKTFKFRIRSIQGAHNVDTDFITFTVKAVADITGQSVVEGQTFTIDDVHIGDIKSADVLSGGPVRATFNGASVSITGTEVDVDTDWSIRVANATGAYVTISGITKHLDDVSASINTGDYIIIGTDILKGLTTPFEIVHDTEHPIVGTATIADNVLRYEASTVGGPIDAGTYPIKVRGNNGATQTVNVVVSSEPDYQGDYLTLSTLDNGEITITIPDMVNQNYATSISYSKDKSNWTETVVDNTAQTITIPVSNGDYVYLKGVAKAWSNADAESCTHINSSASINASGNIMSLLYGDDFKDKTTFPAESQYTFGELFINNTHLINAKNLILPAIVLYANCYKSMFQDCTSLTAAPELPATSLGGSCYSSMFQDCTSLTTAPELPATKLASYCYYNMFKNCTSLVQAPALHVTSVVQGCYYDMFYGCTSLTTATELPATELKLSCYTGMFLGCTSLTTAPELPATTLANYCYQNMFKGCTSLTTAPTILPATTLVADCYVGMFQNCTSLAQAPELPATTLAAGCYDGMFQNCTSLTQAPELPATTLINSCYISMFYGCTSLTSAPELPATTLDSWCYTSMFSGCTSLTTAPALHATTLKNSCYKYMFEGCTSLVKAPELPATTLAAYCYSNMFKNCTSLVQAPALPVTSLTQGCYYEMFLGCTSLTTAPTILPATTLYSDCYNSMFYGCTSLTTAPELPATELWADCYRSMFYGCASLTTAPALPATTLTNRCYFGMFQNCTSLTQAPELPATTLSDSCYTGMFQGCTSLTTAPELPATTLANTCYNFMFYNCTSLVNAPELPATTLATSCYYGMFHGCTSLTTAPELPATTLTNYCYYNMFQNCTSLVQAPALPVTSLTQGCYYEMFLGCTSLTTTPELPATILANSCYTGMFQNCTSLTSAPELLATTLTSWCYASMFDGCASLTQAPELPATNLISNCYNAMFRGCTSLTTAPELPATKLAAGCYYNMFNGCQKLNIITMLATDISASDCLRNWVNGVASTGTFTKAASMTSLPAGISGIPTGWTVQTA